MSLSGLTALITASRGIGLSIAKSLASNGCNIVLLAKTVKPNAKLPGTIYTAAKEVKESIPKDLDPDNDPLKVIPLQLDIRDEKGIDRAMEQITENHGLDIDILINNASAINNSKSSALTSKQFDLMHQVNTRGTFLLTKACIPYLLVSPRPHVITLSPPIRTNPKWYELGGTAYTMSKYSMSMMTRGLAQEYKGQIAFNSLWPTTIIWTSGVRMLLGGKAREYCRDSDIMGVATSMILAEDEKFTGNFLYDEEILFECGLDADEFNLGTEKPLPDLYVGDPDDFYMSHLQFTAKNEVEKLK